MGKTDQEEIKQQIGRESILGFVVFMVVLSALVIVAVMFRDRIRQYVMDEKPTVAQEADANKDIRFVPEEKASWLMAGENIANISINNNNVAGEIHESKGLPNFSTLFGVQAYLQTDNISLEQGKNASKAIKEQLSSYAAQTYQQIKDKTLPKSELARLFKFAVNNNLNAFAYKIFNEDYKGNRSAIQDDLRLLTRNSATQNAIWTKLVMLPPEKQNSANTEEILAKADKDAEKIASNVDLDQFVKIGENNNPAPEPDVEPGQPEDTSDDKPKGAISQPDQKPDPIEEKPKPEPKDNGKVIKPKTNPALSEYDKLKKSYDDAQEFMKAASSASGTLRNQYYDRAADKFERIRDKIEQLLNENKNNPGFIKAYKTKLEQMQEACTNALWECQRFRTYKTR